MKKITLTLAAFIVAWASTAQSINDVVNFGNTNLVGSARFQSMSGAFGALGGDISAININPAASAVFNNSIITLSATNYNIDNNTRYFNETRNTNFSNLQLNQLGGALVFNNTHQDSDWKKFTLAFNYDMAHNYEDEFFATGNSNQSIDQYFLNFADGVPFSDLYILEGENIEDAYLDIGQSFGFGTQQAFLGYWGGIIDPLNDADDNTEYISNAIYNNGTIRQRYLQTTSGYNNKFTANIAGQYLDNFHIGASLNFHDIQYKKYTELDEDNYAPNSPLEFVQFDNLLHTYGSAFSLSLGGIAKVSDIVRLGVSYQSPTWYNLTDELSQRIDSNLADSEIGFINFNQVTVFPDYRIQIPAKLTGSVALVFPEGLLSFDYNYQDMSNAKLRPTSDPVFSAENNFIASNLKAVSTYRLGGEYRIKRWSLRGGYRFEESPYQNNNTVGDLTGYSLGLGYNFGPTKVDLGFNQAQREYNKQLFDTGLTTTANVDRQDTHVTLSLSFNL